MKIGYARVSTARQGQSLDTQREALIDAGCDPDHLCSDTISGTKRSRPGLSYALEYMLQDATIVLDAFHIGPVRKLLTVCLCGCCPGRLV